MRPVSVHIADRVLCVTIERADKRNSLSTETLSCLREVFVANAGDASLVGAVLTGRGDRAFAAGGDLKEFDTARTPDTAMALTQVAFNALEAVRRFPVPVVAVLNGDALGGGAELAVACDTRIFAAHAHIGFVQASLAIPTGWGGGHDLSRIVGGAAALRMLTAAEKLDAKQAQQLGLADVVAEPNRLEEAVADTLRGLRARPAHVLRAIKAIACPPRDAESLKGEMQRFVECWLHEDHWAAHDAIVRSLGEKPARRSNHERND